MKKLEINSLDDPVSIGRQLNSPKSHNPIALRKRRYRQFERFNIDEELDIFSNSDKNEQPNLKNDRKSLKLSHKMLKKASTAVDLISQKVKSKNVIQETISASFVTNVIEVTKDALQALEKNQVTQSEYNMNLLFIKPSHKFYNEIMSHWFKFLYILEEKKEQE